VKSKIALQMTSVVFLLALWPASMPIVAAQTDRLTINGDGSTFAYPMYSKWIEEYEKENPSVHFTNVSNGSGAGIHDVMLGTVDFDGTDGPLNKVQMLDFSFHRNCEVLHFPTALGADVPIYNVPGVIQALNFTPQPLEPLTSGLTTIQSEFRLARTRRYGNFGHLAGRGHGKRQ
jgi:phosphate transport system substrate-binding protein